MISIRKTKESDISQLEKLFLTSRQKTFTWDNPSKFKIQDYRKTTEGETVYIAEDVNGNIIGFISVWEKDKYPFIHHLYIAADYQRQGIGTLLIKSLFAWLPRPYRLKCVLKNQNAVAFYRKNNWLEVDRGIGEDGEYLLLELSANQPLSNITLVPASKEDKATIQNLGRFYVYEMSRSCGFLPTWETPSNGLFECIDLSSYCEKPDRYAFLVKVDDELAGFVLINKVGSTPDVDWNIGEFFIVSKFQGKGVGRYVAEQVFNQLPGIWETSQIPENKAALDFWDKVVRQYSNGQFEKTLKIVPEPKPHPMVILKFTSQGSPNIQCKENVYKVIVDYAPTEADNAVVEEGIKASSHFYSHEMQQQLRDSVELLKMILGPDLLGIYLYGSSLVGGLQKYSDIDLFAVTNRATTSEEKAKLIASLLQSSGIYMKSSKRPLEITLVEKRMINPWQYPPHFDFQYGEYLRDSFEKGIIEPWENYEMPDLAVLVTQVLLGSETLWGLEPSQPLVEVPYHDFMKAMLHDVNRLTADLESDTRNVLLTFARIWSTLETDTIRSKPAAADWVINNLPERYQPVIKRAKSICLGRENEHWDDIKMLIKPCADYMVDNINGRIPLVNFDDPNKRIKLYEQ